jgi:hypothetical protein
MTHLAHLEDGDRRQQCTGVRERLDGGVLPPTLGFDPLHSSPGGPTWGLLSRRHWLLPTSVLEARSRHHFYF